MLQHEPTSTLWLSASPPFGVAELRRSALRAAIEPSRLFVTERLAVEMHVVAKSRADLFIDTRQFSAHSTAVDFLWAGRCR